MNCKLAPLVVGIIRSHLLIRDSGADAFAFIESTSSEGSDHLSRLVQPIIFNVNAYFDVGQLDFRWILLTKPTGTSHGHSLVRKNYRWTRSMSFVSYTIYSIILQKNTSIQNFIWSNLFFYNGWRLPIFILHMVMYLCDCLHENVIVQWKINRIVILQNDVWIILQKNIVVVMVKPCRPNSIHLGRNVFPRPRVNFT